MDISNEINEKVLDLLAEQIGVEKEDILPEYTFSDDLHMSPANFTEFIESLNKIQIDASKIDMTEVETIEDFLEQLEAIQPIE
ncbi:hypothetical protein JXA63_02715 [Candidatus Woesebacteria bacterium]|nr:hypothetical protein [Candidatus Woesebacteria bacterium]